MAHMRYSGKSLLEHRNQVSINFWLVSKNTLRQTNQLFIKFLIVWGRAVQSTRSVLQEAIFSSFNLIFNVGDGGFLKSVSVSLTWTNIYHTVDSLYLQLTRSSR